MAHAKSARTGNVAPPRGNRNRPVGEGIHSAGRAEPCTEGGGLDINAIVNKANEAQAKDNRRRIVAVYVPGLVYPGAPMHVDLEYCSAALLKDNAGWMWNDGERIYL